MRLLYTVAIFLSSALLFLVQPMVARIILPAYGGTAAVWTSSELFFQFVLLLGYGYAHFTSRKLGPRKQPWVHIPLMALALVTLPFATRVATGAEGESTPVLRLLSQLTVMVGLSFFVVSAGAPLIQRWFADTRDPQAKDPYFLYSASNLGSMVALLAYPLLVEPRLKLADQTRLWLFGFVSLLLMMVLCAVAMLRTKAPEVESADDVLVSAVPDISNRTRLKWLGLSAVPSSLLLGVTAYVSTNIAPIPLLWVVPLAIYLLTFILAFKSKPWLTSKPLGRAAGMAIPALMVAIVMEAFDPKLAAVHLAVFFLVAWMCHAKLSESRPSAKHLTEFYFYMSLGGVLGGAFNALLAPIVFNTLFEYPVALIAAGFLLPPFRPEAKRNQQDWLYPVGVALLTGVAILVTKFIVQMPPKPERTAIMVGLPAILCFLAVDRPLRFGLSLTSMVVVANLAGASSDDQVVLSERSFFGVHRVLFSGPNNRYHVLTHGNTMHGKQDLVKPHSPLMYYYSNGPIGQVFKAFSGPRHKQNVALVGLGVGALAAYGEPGQSMTYYEIDPNIKETATNPKFFTYVRDSKANVNFVLGDGRLQLAKAPNGSYGMIVLDAFSSDSIPIHMLTKEAVQMYVSKLVPDGVIAYHISNRYLDLAPIITSIAHDLHLVAYINEDGATDEERAQGKLPSVWMVLAHRKEDLGSLLKSIDWSISDYDPNIKPWTDDFSNVLSALKQEGQ